MFSLFSKNLQIDFSIVSFILKQNNQYSAENEQLFTNFSQKVEVFVSKSNK